MFLIYRTATGEIVDNTGTNSFLPEGPDDELAWSGFPDRAGLAALRLHDERDTELVDIVLQGAAKVRNGRIVEVEKPPTATPPVTPPAEVDVIAQIAALQAWAKDIQGQVDATTEILMGGLQ